MYIKLYTSTVYAIGEYLVQKCIGGLAILLK